MRRGYARLMLLWGLAAAGCAVVPPPPEPVPVSANAAVVALVDSARVDLAAGRAGSAAAALERALRIEPRNAQLWHELARLRLSEGDYPQAEALAKKSNAGAGEDRRLRAANWRLIGEARIARGDALGAQAALERAAELEK